jgi:nucleoside-diphosphate-sugar epimerase
LWSHRRSLSNDPTAEFDPEATHSINYTGTINLANACKENGIGRFIFASSGAVYGFHLEDPADEHHSPFPQSAYAKSKLDVDIELQRMADDSFCPVSLRQATVFGFSPRMRWDIVVNAFVMHAFKNGKLDVWFGGEAWRPLVHVKDVAQAYISCLEAEPGKVRGQVFNLVYGNYRILDVAQRVSKALSGMGINTDIDINRDQIDSRSYRISGNKITEHLNFNPNISIEEGTKEIADVLKQGKYRDFDHPIYYNVRWMQLLVEIEERLSKTGRVL